MSCFIFHSPWDISNVCFISWSFHLLLLDVQSPTAQHTACWRWLTSPMPQQAVVSPKCTWRHGALLPRTMHPHPKSSPETTDPRCMQGLHMITLLKTRIHKNRTQSKRKKTSSLYNLWSVICWFSCRVSGSLGWGLRKKKKTTGQTSCHTCQWSLVNQACTNFTSLETVLCQSSPQDCQFGFVTCWCLVRV